MIRNIMVSGSRYVEESPMGRVWFTTTHWSVVLRAARTNTPLAVDALEQLCRAYWYPLYAFVRRYGYSPEDAQDLTQGFFARFIAKEYLEDVDRAKGRFRSFLLAAMKHFLANQWDRAHARKRGGSAERVTLEGAEAERRYHEEPVSDLSPDKLYEQRWACRLLEQVMVRLESGFQANGQGGLFLELKPFLIGESRSVTYADLAGKLGVSEASLKMKVQRMRHRYQRLLREEIARTVSDPEEVDDEIGYLFRVLSA